jgi:predicted ester cyclase
MTTTTTSTATHGGLTRQAAADLALRSIQIMVDGSPADFVAVVHPDAVNREARDEPPECRGRGPEAYYATALWLRSTFSEMRFDVHEVVVDGDLVVVHTTMSGRQTGVASIYDDAGRVERAMPATKRRFAASHTHWLRLRDGLIVEHWANRDDLATAAQLGWVPPTPCFLVRAAIATRRARRTAPVASERS